MRVQRRRDVGEEPVEHGLRVGAGGGGEEHEVTGARVVELLELGRHLGGRARGRDAVDHRFEVLVVGATHRAGGFLARGVAVGIDVEEHPHAPVEAREVTAGVRRGLADDRAESA